MRAKVRAVATARLQIQRADGRREVHYSMEKIPFWHLRRRRRQRAHLRFMKQEELQWP